MSVNMAGAATGAASGAQIGSMFGPVGTGVGAVAGGLLGAFSGGDEDAAAAAKAQQDAAIAAQEKWNMQQDPFSATGSRLPYVQKLNDFVQGGYQGASQDPMFQWMQQQGMENTQRGLSARGLGGSGQEMLALSKQGYGMAHDFYNEQYNRLADLSGASRGGGASTANLYMTGQNAFDQTVAGNKAAGQNFQSMLGSLDSIFGSFKGSTAAPSGATS